MPNFIHPNRLAARAKTPDVVINAPQIRVLAGYGRLYATGTHAHLLQGLPGATKDERRDNTYQLSLTLPTLRRIRQKLNMTQQQMAAACTPEVLRWAKAAGEQERKLLELHQRIASGYRSEATWADGRAGQPAPPEAPENQTEWCANHGRQEYKYRVPYDHQKVMATVAIELDGCAILGEMGTGKTRAAIAAAEQLIARNIVDYVLVVCPKGVMNTWEREVRQWSTMLPHQLRGSGREVAAAVRDFARVSTASRKVLAVNYDKIANLQDDFVRLLDSKRVLVILDEMHVIKNPQAAVTQACMELSRHATRRLGMTGTPIANGAYDIWSQWYFVDLGITFGANFVQFRREFYQEYAWSWTVDPLMGAHDEIGTRMQLRGVRYRKEDCLDLPPKNYEIVEIELTRAQRQAYNEMKEQLIAWLRGQEPGRLAPGDADDDQGDVPFERDGRVATAANQLVAMMRLTQITSGHVKDENGDYFHFSPNPKLAKCSELVREIVATGRSVIVWAIYRPDIQSLMDELRDLQPVRIDGTQQGASGARERDEAERKFQAGETKVLIGNPGAGGVGLNLQRASTAIYYSKSYSYVQRAQSEDRCHRSGSDIHSRITYIDLLAEDTIDFEVHAIVEGKKDVSAAVVDLRRALGV
jgi:SNF2 family DNA or RNA helicase